MTMLFFPVLLIHWKIICFCFKPVKAESFRLKQI
jgi:hypothetical protein